MARKTCNDDHRYDEMFKSLPIDQGGIGRHRCAACAFKRGFEQGRVLDESPNLDLDSLPESQAGTVRHRSPHAAWARGYLVGLEYAYTQDAIRQALKSVPKTSTALTKKDKKSIVERIMRQKA